jgi:acyl-CoA reductase-like NAD-dependent aldehyde dehydrogenase
MSLTTPALPDLSEEARASYDSAIDALRTGAAAWAALPLAERAVLLRRTHTAIAAHREEWALTGSAIKGLDPESPLVGEEWMTGPYATLGGLTVLIESVSKLASGISPLTGARFGAAPGGRTTVKVAPHTAVDGLLLNGFSAEIWLEPGISVAQATRDAGLGELTPTTNGGVGLVLGAGNVTSIPPLDVLYELVAANRAVLLKLNPIMARMKDVYDAALAPLIEFGVLRVVQGGGAEGGYLTSHPGIAHVHMTGSAATHDAIVWGVGPDAIERKKSGTPKLTKPITSELGGVSPVIVVPGAWTKRDLVYQAEHVATMRLHNGGYNCIAGQIVVVSSDWAQKDEFLDAVRAAVERAPQREPWYPGSADRVANATSAYPDAERVGGQRLIVDMKADDDARYLETTECFSPVLGVIELPGTGQEFLDTAVETVNRDFVGTLGANVLVDPADVRRLGPGFRESIAALRYGNIAINTWTGVIFATATASWGAFPGHTIEDVQSGIGVVHNALLLADTERTVMTGPFRPFPRSVLHGEFALFPKPPWFVTARSGRATGRLLADFAAKTSLLKLPAIFASAFKA